MLAFDSLNVDDKIKSELMQFEIDFAFQPIFSREGDIVAYEALMRPEGRNVLDYIEEMRRKNKLHALELASFFGATMAYRLREYDKKLCINSFPSECFTVEEAKAYSECFKPIKDKLVIEILEYTEGEQWMWKTKEAHTKVYEGIEVSLDDFGTGYSSLNMLRTFPVDVLKIDRSFILDLEQNSKTVLSNIIRMADELHMDVVAEGVETYEQMNYLKSIDCKEVQGFLFDRPMPIENFEQKLISKQYVVE